MLKKRIIIIAKKIRYICMYIIINNKIKYKYKSNCVVNLSRAVIFNERIPVSKSSQSLMLPTIKASDQISNYG